MRILKYRLSDGTVTTSYAVAKEDRGHTTFLEDWVEPESEEDKAKRLARIAKMEAIREAKRKESAND